MITFSEIQSSALEATCSHCNVTTIFTGKMRYRIDSDNKLLLVPEYQCQDCGKLTLSNPDYSVNTDILSKRCDCGGQFRRDKPLFCPSCLKNRTDQNFSE